MTGVERIEQRARLDAAHLAQDDPVGPPAQSCLEEFVEGDAGLEGVGLALEESRFGFWRCSSDVSSMTTIRCSSGIAAARALNTVSFRWRFLR